MRDPKTFGFSSALDFIRDGKRVGRKEWRNARYVFLVDGSEFTVNRAPLDKFFAEGTKVSYRPHIDMVGMDESIGTWSPSMVDIMALDWYEIIE